ncbi:hypothetical protein HPB52_008623 [Rhipicephalus sanguineus]|uniref:TRAF1-6 MATH domain-containing protein n=1 Tax=Rhipicephalus sanguineus TaxID=34632 RepID=A0A9D4QCZ3_RHISA|nr:hypothetical protein HPB52_008623 [Rhipicephalus sanguineus]
MIAGPFRAAAKPGVFVTMVAFFDIYAKHESLVNDKTSLEISGSGGMAGGYTFALDYWLRQSSDDVALSFRMRLMYGEWDDYVEWPFSKKITIIITHLRDRNKDIRLPIKNSGHGYFKKPAPRAWNRIMNTMTLGTLDFHATPTPLYNASAGADL